MLEDETAQGVRAFANPHPPARCNEALPVDAAHAEVFDFEEFLDAAFRAPVTRPEGSKPLSFMPPKGAISVEMMPSLMPTMPYSSASATRQMRPMSRL
jgi:hypothetical protein